MSEKITVVYRGTTGTITPGAEMAPGTKEFRDCVSLEMKGLIADIDALSSPSTLSVHRTASPVANCARYFLVGTSCGALFGFVSGAVAAGIIR